MTPTDSQIRKIGELVQGSAFSGVPLSRFTSFKIGGPADVLAEPCTVVELTGLLRYLAREGLPYIVLGSGTNVLFPDAGFRGVVVRTVSISGFEVIENGSDHASIRAAAGMPLPSLVNRTSKLAWKGLEPLWGIPGSFGGAIAGNAGVPEACIGDFLVEIDLLTPQGEAMKLVGEEIDYEYRHMKIPSRHVITGGTLRLKRGTPEAIRAEIAAAKRRRERRQPVDKPSAGCIFRNPAPDKPAGLLIDGLGLKGMAVGGAQVSEVHANFIVNRGNATASDVLELIRLIRERVRQAENLELELEIRMFDEEVPYD